MVSGWPTKFSATWHNTKSSTDTAKCSENEYPWVFFTNNSASLRLKISMVLNARSIFIMGFSKYFETLCIQLSRLSQQRILVDNFWESSSAFSDKFTVCTKKFLVLWGWWTLNYAEYHIKSKRERGWVSDIARATSENYYQASIEKSLKKKIFKLCSRLVLSRVVT